MIATGQQYSVRQFVIWAAEELGVTLRFEGSGVDEVGIVDSVSGAVETRLKPGDVIVRVDPRYFRPAEVESLVGDATGGARNAGLEARDDGSRNVRRDDGRRTSTRLAAMRCCWRTAIIPNAAKEN